MIPVWAQTVSAQNDLQVTAPVTLVRVQIVNGCQLNNLGSGVVALGTLHFGDVYDLDSLVDATTSLGSGSLQVRCTPGTSAKVTLGSGLYGSSVNDRKMRLVDGTATLSYQLYTSSTRQTIWDDVMGVSLLFTDDNVKSLSIYGRIPAQVTPAAGHYYDQVVVTLTY